MLGPLALGSLSQGAQELMSPLGKAIGPRTAACLGACSATAPEAARAALLPRYLSLPELQFAAIMGFISEIICFPTTENIKF